MPKPQTLPEFYSTEQGQKFAGFLLEELTKNWPVYDSDKICGLGYCDSYREQFQNARYYIDSSMTEMDITQLPFRNSELNKFFAIHFAENCADPLQALQEIWRALEPDGELVLIVPAKNSMWKKTAITGKYEIPENSVREVLLTSKFQIKQVRHNIFYPPKMKTGVADLVNRYFPFGGAVTIYYAKKTVFENRGRGLKVSEGILDKLMPKKKVAQA